MSHSARHRGRGAAAAATVLVVLLGVAACATEDPPAPEPGAGTPEPTPDETVEPEPTETATTDPTTPEVEVAVHFLVDTRTGLRLAREVHEVPGQDPVRGAVEAMLSGPDDPDYSTTWDPATQVLSVTEDAGTVTVDLSAAARTANAGSEGAALMVQQLVHTATTQDPEASVSLLIEGEPAGELWGAVVWDEPQTRADALDVRLLTQLDAPVEGETVSSPVTVTGEAAAFEANVPWQVLDPGGTEVTSGFTMTSEGQTFAPFSFEVELDPGTYTVVATEDDPSDGEAGTPMSDSRTFTVE